MRTHLLASVLVVAAGATASAAPAPDGPDFVAARPAHAVDRSLAASSGDAPIAPLDVLAFQLGQAALLPSAQAQIDTAAKWLRAHPTFRLVVEGHTDRAGTDLYNVDLATRRADTVRHRLIADGVASDRIMLVVFGENDAIVPTNPNDRRVVIYASDRPAREIALASFDVKHAESAVWTERGALVQQQRTAGEKPREVIATRK